MLIFPIIIFSAEGITAGSTPSKSTTKPIILPIIKPVRPIVRPIVNTGLVYQDNYYTTNTTNNCESYIEMLNQKDAKIAALTKELKSLKNKEQATMQKNLKKEYDKEMQKFENRKSNSTTKSSAVISNKPID